jgi:hypothetical protein
MKTVDLPSCNLNMKWIIGPKLKYIRKNCILNKLYLMVETD